MASSSSSSSSWVMVVVLVVAAVVQGQQSLYDCQVLQSCKTGTYSFLYDGLYGPQCYFMQFANLVTWEQARQRCKKENAELASSFICPGLLHSIFKESNFPHGIYWIGATDIKEKTWYYLNGWPVHCSYFRSPPAASTSQQCGAVYFFSNNDTTMYITSYSCSTPIQFSLCEMPGRST